MKTITQSLATLDSVAGINKSNPLITWLERAAFVFATIMVLTSPHSIAASQTGWVVGSICLIASIIARVLFKEKLSFNPTFLALPLLALFLWTVLTVFTSYAPDISARKLPSASLFTVFFLITGVVRTRKALKFLVFGIFISCMVNVVWMPIERIPGRGIAIYGLTEGSALARSGLLEGDTLLEINGRKITWPQEILDEVQRTGKARIRYYRPDYHEEATVDAEDLAESADPAAALGFENWRRNRNWRSSGFYGMYATYSEVLVLIGSLVAGLFAAGLYRKLNWEAASVEDSGVSSGPGKWILAGLGASLAMVGVALLMTQTRASQGSLALGLMICAFLSFGRKGLIAVFVVLIPAAAIGLYLLQTNREISYIDAADKSTTWRMTVYSEAIGLWSDSPRNAVFGVGMDSRKRFGKEWELFVQGGVLAGHFHSTPLQLLVERGLPALLLWLWVVFSFLRRTWSTLRGGPDRPWWVHGLLIGGFVGVIGFFTSGFVHYNLGDSEVAMVMFILMGFTVLAIDKYDSGAATESDPLQGFISPTSA